MIDLSTHNRHNKIKKITDTMIPLTHQLPAASILQVSAIASSRAIDLDLCIMAMHFLLP
jgi:hypothetical protein